MEPTQVALVAGLLALLVLLLVVRSAGRRRERRAAVEPAPLLAPPAEESGEQPVAEVAPEPEAYAEPEAEPYLDPEPAAEPEPYAERALPALAELQELQEQLEMHELPETDEQPDAAEQSQGSEQPRPKRSRGLFGRRRAKVAAEAAAPELTAEPDAEPGASEPVSQAELRALREQLRVLEQVVQEQANEHPTMALAAVEDAVAEQSAAYLRQVSLVVRGLAAHTSEEENPRRTLARVAAAVERLGVPNQMERPVLPVTRELTSGAPDAGQHPSHLLPGPEQGAHPVASAPTVVTDVFAGLDAAAEVQPPVVQAPVAEPQPFVDPAPAVPYDQPEPASQHTAAFAVPEVEMEAGIPAYTEPEVVLPVPPPAAPEPSRRRRGRKSR